MKTEKELIKKQKEVIIILTKALNFLADNNLIKERRDNNDTDNQPLIDCVNKSAELKKEISALESSMEQSKGLTADGIKHKINKIICRYYQYEDYKTNEATDDLFNLIKEFANSGEKLTDEEIEKIFPTDKEILIKNIDESMNDSERFDYLNNRRHNNTLKQIGARWYRDRNK